MNENITPITLDSSEYQKGYLDGYAAGVFDGTESMRAQALLQIDVMHKMIDVFNDAFRLVTDQIRAWEHTK